MKKKTIIVLILILLGIVSFVIPIKQEKIWVNDDPVLEVGHYELQYKNIYGFILKKEKK